MKIFNTMDEAFDAGYALPRWTLIGYQEWRYFGNTFLSDSIKSVAEMIQLGNSKMLAIKLV